MSNEKKGFASMPGDEKKGLQSKGGKASHVAGRKKSSKAGGTSKRGFAAMDPEEQRKIAKKGGQASHGGGRHSGS